MNPSRTIIWQEMIELSPLCSGSLHEQYLTCGKLACRCHYTKSPQLHGPYYLWIRRIGGRQVNRTLRPGPELERVKTGIQNYRRFQRVLEQEVIFLGADATRMIGFKPCSYECSSKKSNRFCHRSAPSAPRVKKLQEEVQESMMVFLQNLHLSPLSGEEPIDTGAEEELFRDVGRHAAAEVLARRWESADSVALRSWQKCGIELQDLGLRAKVFRTLCGPTRVRRRVGYCDHCRETTATLDERLGADETGVTPGLRRVICRVALELAYEPTRLLLRDTLGFSPCSARQIERIANSHGEQMDKPGSVAGEVRHQRAKRIYCLAIDGVMIPGLPDPQQHRILWHEVKLATIFDPRDIEPSFYVAAPEDSDTFGRRLWSEFESRGMDGNCLLQVLGDGAPWIWNLADMHFQEFGSCWISIMQLSICTRRQQRCGRRELPMHGGTGV